MKQFTDAWAIPWLVLLADWSVRWGVVLVSLAIWFAIHPPRRASTRHVLCWAALAAGLLIPVAPRWGGLGVPWAIGLPPEREQPTEAVSLLPMQHVQSARPVLATVLSYAAEAPSPAMPAAARSVSVSGLQLTALAIASAWAFGVLVLLTRLFGGWLLLTRLARGAVEIAADSDAMILECKAAIGLHRAVRLAAHRAIGSPVAFGCFAPCILVPDDWGSWSKAQRRACLLHELTHLKRRDDWFKLAQELISIFFFFHPMVRWLLARLDRERELLCDESVVAHGMEPEGYARILLEMARRPARMLALPASTPVAVLAVLDHRTVRIRISRLLEDDMSETLSRTSLRRSLALGALLAAISLAMTEIRIRAVEPRAAAPSQQPALSRKIEGLIRDPEGKPVAGASVVVWTAGAAATTRSVLQTDARGKFIYSSPDGPGVIQLVAVKEGLAPGFSQKSSELLKPPDRLEVTLGRIRLFSAILVDGQGKPLRDSRIRVEAIAHVSSHTIGARTTISSRSDWIRRNILAGSPLAGLLETTTAADGSFSLALPERAAGVMLGASAADAQGFRIRARRKTTDSIRLGIEQEGCVIVTHGQSADLVAIPEARISGRVVTSLPGVRVAGLTVTFQTPHAYPGMTNVSPEHVLTDANGRFQFNGLNEGSINVFVQGEGEDEWTYRAGKDVILTPGETSSVTIELIKGVIVEGAVTGKETKDPIPGLWVSVKGPLSPRTGARTTMLKTDAHGRYRFRLPPGETDFQVIGPVFGKIARLTVSVPEDRANFEMPVIEVETDPTIRGLLLDSDGQAVVGATILGIDNDNMLQPFLGAEFVTDGRGKFVLPSEVYKNAARGHQTRLRIRLPDALEQTAIVSFAPDNSVVVRLDRGGPPR